MKMLRLCFLFFAVVFLLLSCKHVIPVNGLTKEDSLRISQLRSKAISFFTTNPDSFASLQLQIAARYKAANRLSDWLNCYDSIIHAYRSAQAFDKMLSAYEQLYKNLWKEPEDSFSLVTLAESNRQVARYYYKTENDYQQALHFYDLGIELMSRAHAWTTDASRVFYKAAGNCASRMDDYERSISYNEHNVEVCRKQHDTINLWQGLNDLSYPYMQAGKYDKAEQALREGYRLVIKSDSVEQKVDVCSSLADLFTQKNQLDSAQKYLTLCFAYLNTWQNKEADSQADIYRQQALLYSMQKNYAAAEKYYSRSVTLMMSSNEGTRRECGKLLGEFGSMYVQAGKFEEALDKFHESLQCLVPGFKSKDKNAVPDSSLLINENGIFLTCEGMGDASIQLFQKTYDSKYLVYADQQYHAARLVLDKREKEMQNEASRIYFEKCSAGILTKVNTTDSLLKMFQRN